MRYFVPAKEWFDQRRTATRAMVLLRLVLLLCVAAIAGALLLLYGGGGLTRFGLALLAVGALSTALNPDAIGATSTLTVVAAWVWFAGRDHPLWQAGLVGLLCLLFHLVCTLAAAGPMHSDLDRRTVAWAARHGIAVLLLAGVAVAVVAAVVLLPVPTSLAWTAAALLGVVVLTVALTAVRREPGDS